MDSDRPKFLHRAGDLIRRHLPQVRPEYDSDNPLARDERTSSLDKLIPRFPPLAHISQRQHRGNASNAHRPHDGQTLPFDKRIPHSPWQQYLRRPPIAHISTGPGCHGEELHFLPVERVCRSHEQGSRTPEHEPNPPIGQIRNNTTGVIRDWKPEDGEPDQLQSGETRYRDFATEPSRAYCCQCATCTCKYRRNPGQTHRYAEGAQTTEHRWQ